MIFLPVDDFLPVVSMTESCGLLAGETDCVCSQKEGHAQSHIANNALSQSLKFCITGLILQQCAGRLVSECLYFTTSNSYLYFVTITF